MKRCNFIFFVCRLECSENEKKAQEEYDKIYEGMKEVNDKMKVITDAKKEKETACKKIVKYVFYYSLIEELVMI